MGGMGRIYYASLREYAKDHDIKLYPFLTYMQALDDVWLDWNAKRALSEQEETDNG